MQKRQKKLKTSKMVGVMHSIAELGVELTSEEKDLFSIGYDRLMNAKLLKWRGLAKDHAANGDSSVIAEEMRQLAQKFIHLIDASFLKAELEAEQKALFLKLKADCLGYLAEIETGDDYKDATGRSISAYKDAYEVAWTLLSTTSPLRLTIALNLSTFYYEVAKLPEQACHIGKEAFDLAIGDKEQISEDERAETMLVMQLIRDNLVRWTSEPDDEG
ncbi:unnamed protein product [Dibothriocephalus latus]|uniref:14-3-3 domain-containing protein n=1 Tax=Dibothriocephalus latus TaxID=60516 RepID=A0A3P7L3G8_DIBLA|nr:unnamed protein product [Dibothriocephalus latus]